MNIFKKALKPTLRWGMYATFPGLGKIVFGFLNGDGSYAGKGFVILISLPIIIMPLVFTISLIRFSFSKKDSQE